MDINPIEVSIKDLTDQYRDSVYSGVRGYHDQLDIRPAYQREMVYSQEEEEAVIDSIINGFPIGIMYWAENNVKGKNGLTSYEVIDGQQRIISICQYVALDKFTVNGKIFSGLSAAEQEKINKYSITVYICKSEDEQEKLDWFKRINIAGKALSAQELRNSAYTGAWLTSAKEYFKTGGAAYEYNKFLKTPRRKLENRDFDWKRWDGLELAISWAADGDDDKDITDYMAHHQQDENADELWERFESVFDWIEETFGEDIGTLPSKFIKADDWNEMYKQYHNNEYDAEELNKKIKLLMNDEEITSKHGIFWYVLDPKNNEHKLSLRQFKDDIKKSVYEEQNHRCPICYHEGETKEYDYSDLQGDHIQPWSKGGKTVRDNCVMLCALHNNTKSAKNISEELLHQYIDEVKAIQNS